MTEEIIHEYLAGGGKFFSVKSIDIIRDGGTIAIETTTSGKYYIHHVNKTVHYSYPPREDNVVEDRLLLVYLIDRINSYVEISERQIKRNKEMLTEIRIKNG